MVAPPVFFRANVSFEAEQNELRFARRNVSIFGVTGLPWAPLDPAKHFGLPVLATVETVEANALTFRISANLVREQTAQSIYMGLKFQLETQEAELVRSYIKRYGYTPPDYVRQYPRIPASKAIQTFPLFAQVALRDSGHSPADAPRFVMSVADMSPSGILLSSENQAATAIGPMSKLDIALEPRGWFPMTVRSSGQVCRVIDEISDQNGNLVRHFGIRFQRMDDVNRAAYLDLLRDILLRVQPDKAD